MTCAGVLLDVGQAQQALSHALIESSGCQTLPAIDANAPTKCDPRSGVDLLVIEVRQRRADQGLVEAGDGEVVLDARWSPPLRQSVLDEVGGVAHIVDRAELRQAVDCIAGRLIAIPPREPLLQLAAGMGAATDQVLLPGSKTS